MDLGQVLMQAGGAGLAACVVGHVPPKAAAGAGTYAVVSTLTASVFQAKGLIRIVKFIFGAFVTAQVVNFLFDYNFTLSNAAYTIVLPGLAILKIIAVAGCSIAIYAAYNYCNKEAKGS